MLTADVKHRVWFISVEQTVLLHRKSVLQGNKLSFLFTGKQ